ncbi:uncharacterized protein PV06_10245 [Exophiala oligosperma]|uniref:Uncharacterized protein n=1 Tax=Exophiala oligosperma TaxID=215243 RepID=A0A0D2BJM9_9EURO|nr:uncharacterized protein PV06_10245 [Exophiala oligosperma]KIW37602.1 hypothetical protein PV06_10245 [Exophiala oligosperma]
MKESDLPPQCKIMLPQRSYADPKYYFNTKTPRAARWFNSNRDVDNLTTLGETETEASLPKPRVFTSGACVLSSLRPRLANHTDSTEEISTFSPVEPVFSQACDPGLRVNMAMGARDSEACDPGLTLKSCKHRIERIGRIEG